MPGANAVETQINDQLMYRAPLPYTGRFYPYGFPVDVASDAREVLEAAQESYGVWTPRFDRPPIRMHVLASEGSPWRPPSPVLRGQRNLLMWVSDAENFAVCDRLQRFGYSCVTHATIADHVFFRWHFLDAVVSVMLEMNYFLSMHAACVAWEDAGVMLFGDSGVGKSTISYACARRGWTYISDDASSVLWDNNRNVIGEPHRFRFRAEAPDLFPELRGRTVGYQLDRKPTIEVHTAELPIRTAPECRVERIVFLDRQPGVRAKLHRIGKEEARERIQRDMALFDPELDARRHGLIDSIAAVAAFEMRYSNYEEAVVLLEQMVQVTA